MFQKTHEEEEDDDDDAPLAALVPNQRTHGRNLSSLILKRFRCCIGTTLKIVRYYTTIYKLFSLYILRRETEKVYFRRGAERSLSGR